MSAAVTMLRPYIGLRYFEERDAHLYFGRDEHVTQLIEKLAQNRLVAVMGSSGSGKSSLVRAGLLPELRSGMIPQAGPLWKVVEFKPGRAPLGELSSALRTALPLKNACKFVDEGPLGVARAVAEANLEDRTNVLVIADQFEEVFRFQREEANHGRAAAAFEECRALVRRLLDAAAQPELSIYVLLVIRSDYLGECSQFPDLPECMSESVYLVPRLRRDQLQEAIMAPVGGSIYPAVVQRLLSEVGSDPDQLPRLQHLLGRMWECAGGARLAMTHYEQVGGWDKALEHHLESVRQSLGDERQEVCRRLFQQLGELDKGQAVRRRAPAAELIEVCGPGTLEVVAAFRAEGFLAAQNDLVDVTHECILRGWPLMHDWLELEQQNAKRLLELAEAALEAGWQPNMDPRQEKTLFGLTGLQLQILSRWRAEARPAPAWARRYPTPVDFETADGYLSWSQERDQLQKRRITRLKRFSFSLIAVLFLGLAATTRQFYVQKLSAVVKEHIAYAASFQLADPALALYLGYSAAARSMTPGLESVLAAALTNGASYGVLREKSVIYRIGWSPDGRTLASANSDGTIRLWDVASLQELRTLQGHQGVVWSVAWSPDSKTLAAASDDRMIRLWDVASGQIARVLLGHDNPRVNNVAWSPDGRLLASAGDDDGTIRLWEVATGQPLRVLRGHNGRVFGLAWSPNGKTLASGAANPDRTIRLWEVATGQTIRTLHGHQGVVDAVAWSPDGHNLASASGDRTVCLWKIANGQLLRTLHGHQDTVRSVAWSPDGRTLASSGRDRTIRVWDVADVANGQLVRTLHGHQSYVHSVVWSPDGRTLASASQDSTIRLWDVQNGQTLRTMRGHKAAVVDVAFSPNAQMLASASMDHTIRLSEVATGQTVRTLHGHKDTVRSLTWRSDGKLLASSSVDRTIRLWDVQSGQSVRTLHGHEKPVWTVAWSPDGHKLASASEDETIQLWDAPTGQLIRTLHGGKTGVRSVAWRSDGELLASSSVDGTIRLWNIQSGQILRTLQGHKESVVDVTWSPDGQMLASASLDGTVRLWNVARGQPLRTLDGGRYRVWTVAWSDDSKRLASAGNDGTVRLWEVATGQSLRTLSGHEKLIWSVAWSPDGKMLASGSDDGTVRLWPGTTAALLEQVRHAIRQFTPASSECLRYFGSETCDVVR